jgi:hypothetical protein
MSVDNSKLARSIPPESGNIPSRLCYLFFHFNFSSLSNISKDMSG